MMWTTKEVILFSIVAGIISCFSTIYTQRKIQQYIEKRVTEKSINPLTSLVSGDIGNLGQTGIHVPIVEPVDHPTHQSYTSPPKQENKKMYHEPPPGSGERWTPMEIN